MRQFLERHKLEKCDTNTKIYYDTSSKNLKKISDFFNFYFFNKSVQILTEGEGHYLTREAHYLTHEAHHLTHEAHHLTHEAHHLTHEAHHLTHEAHYLTLEAYYLTHEAHYLTHEAKTS